MTIAERYSGLMENIQDAARKNSCHPNTITLVAVSKGVSLDQILALSQLNVKDFGENRIAEALEKKHSAPDGLRWHFIGSLQKNKVRKAVGEFALIHSVDSLELAKKISDISTELQMKTSLLLQANTSGESSKHGLPSEQWMESFEQVLEMPNLNICGLMTMAPLTDDQAVVRKCFSRLRELRDTLQQQAGNACRLNHLSMGMSQDYESAIAEGATLLRIGSALFA
jgi:PLP dependent protein